MIMYLYACPECRTIMLQMLISTGYTEHLCPSCGRKERYMPCFSASASYTYNSGITSSGSATNRPNYNETSEVKDEQI